MLKEKKNKLAKITFQVFDKTLITFHKTNYYRCYVSSQYNHWKGHFHLYIFKNKNVELFIDLERTSYKKS